MSRKPAKALVLATLFLVLVPIEAGAQPSKGEPPKPAQAASDEAKQRYARGQRLASDGDYESALVEFQRAYDLAPSYIILYNIGVIQVQRHDYVAALNAYQRYLEGGGAQIAEARRTTVQKEMAQLREQVASVDVRSNVAGAEIFVDDVSMGKIPLAAPITINAGQRKISAQKSGYPPVAKVIVIAGRDNTKVELELFEPAPSKPAEPLPKVASAPQRRPVPWVGWAFTGAFTAGAVTTGVLALVHSASLRDARGTLGVSQATLDSKQTSTRALGIASDVLTGSAVLAFGLSLYFTLSPAPAPPATATATGALRLDFGPGRVDITGSF